MSRDAKDQPAGDASVKLENQLCFVAYASVHMFNKASKPLRDPLGKTWHST